KAGAKPATSRKAGAKPATPRKAGAKPSASVKRTAAAKRGATAEAAARPARPAKRKSTQKKGAAAKLAPYAKKRDFDATPEPAGAVGAAGGLPRFVIHQHSARRLHWDLRLEHEGVLASWAVPKGNYGAGQMTIWDRGTYELLKWEPRKVEVRLDGERLQARYALFAIDKDDPPKDWMIHRMDPPADPAREAMPERVVPMLARTGELPADDEDWGFEIKWDGVRAIAYCAPGEVRLESRNLKEISDSYPELGRLDRA